MQENESWEEVIVDASFLRQALGLLLHDLLENGVCHSHAHSKTLGLMLKTLITEPL